MRDKLTLDLLHGLWYLRTFIGKEILVHAVISLLSEEASELLTKCQLWLTAVKFFPETVATLGVGLLTITRLMISPDSRAHF